MSEFSLDIIPDQWDHDFFTIVEIKLFLVLCGLELKTRDLYRMKSARWDGCPY